MMPGAREPRSVAGGPAADESARIQAGLAATLAGEVDAGVAAHAAARAAALAAGAAVAAVFVLDEATGDLRCLAVHGIAQGMHRRLLTLALQAQSVVGRTLASGERQEVTVGESTRLDRRLLTLLDGQSARTEPLLGVEGALGVLLVAGAAPVRDERALLLSGIAAQLSAALAGARGRARAALAARRLAILAELDGALDAITDLGAAGAALCAATLPLFGDWTVLHLRGADGSLSRGGSAHADARLAGALASAVDGEAPGDTPALVSRALAEGAPVWIGAEAGIGASTGVPAALAETATLAGCVPIEHGGAVIALLLGGGSDAAAVGYDDPELLWSAARRVGAIVAAAGRVDALGRRGRREAFLAETAHLLAESLSPAVVLQRLAERATGMLGELCLIFPLGRERLSLPRVLLHHVDSRISDLLARSITPEAILRRDTAVAETVLAGRIHVLNDGEAISRLSSSDDVRQFIKALKISAAMFVPIRGGSALAGVMMLVRQDGGQYAAEDERLAERMAEYASAAIVNADLYATAQAERARLQAVLDRLPEAIIIAEPPAGQIVMGNAAAAAALGRPIAPVTADAYQGFYDLQLPTGAPFPAEELALTRALQGETVAAQEIWVRRPDEVTAPLLVNAGPIMHADGTVLSAVAVFQDITAIKDAERAKDEWLSMASHELRTPVTALRGVTQLLLRRLRRGDTITAEVLEDRLTTVERQTDRLLGLITDLLDVSRIQLGRVILRRESGDLADVVRVSFDRARLDAHGGDHRWRFEPAAEPLSGWWDAERLDQVFTNLLGNAVKYSPEGGEITVSLARVGEEAHVRVADQGIGIAPADLDAIFQPFARARGATRRGISGTGLGLYISHDIVERHGGRLWAESREGVGTTFTVALPLDRDSPSDDGRPDLRA